MRMQPMSLRRALQGMLFCLPTLILSMVLWTLWSPESIRTGTEVSTSYENPLKKPDYGSATAKSQQLRPQWAVIVTMWRLFKQSSQLETNLSTSEKPTLSTSISPEIQTSMSGSTSVHSVQSLPSRRWPTLWRGSLRLPFLRVEGTSDSWRPARDRQIADGGAAPKAASEHK